MRQRERDRRRGGARLPAVEAVGVRSVPDGEGADEEGLGNARQGASPVRLRQTNQTRGKYRGEDIYDVKGSVSPCFVLKIAPQRGEGERRQGVSNQSPQYL